MQKRAIKIERQPDGRYIVQQGDDKSEPLEDIGAAVQWLIRINGEDNV
jgi:hypothetical protein